MRTVFLGGGRITTALIAGLRLAHYRCPLVVHDRNPHKLQKFRKHGVRIEGSLQRAVAHADLLIIAVRPDSVAELLGQVRCFLRQAKGRKRSTMACSLAAGIPLARLRAQLGLSVPWARAMPSPVSRTSAGLTGIVFDRRFPRGARKQLVEFFAQVGPVLEIPEGNFDAFTVTYSASHGYHALTAMANAAMRLGLGRKSAYAAAAHALADGIASWRKTGDSLDELLQEAATPGGIAATVMRSMDAAGYSSIVERGLRAGIQRAKKNAKW